MAHEEYKVGSSSINSTISLSVLTPINVPAKTQVKHITVVNGSGQSTESPIGNDARVYVGSNQFKSLKDDLTARRKVVVRYDATPMPNSTNPVYEEISNFSHYTTA
jgi:hypothetical protein